jgi:hypothetical protein
MGISLHRGPIAELRGELIYQGLGERDEESSGNGASPFVEAL